MRARSDAIVASVRRWPTPLLTVRLPGLEARSPARIVLDRLCRLPLSSKLVATAHEVPLFLAACPEADPARKAALEKAVAKFLATETFVAASRCRSCWRI